MSFGSFLKGIGSGLANAVTGGLSGLVGGLFGLPTEMASNALSKADTKELMQYQYELNQKAIDAQNAYNTPLQQMNRLREAQLNPNLVYGNGSVVGNTSAAANVNQAKPRAAELTKYAQMATQLDFARAQQDINLSEANQYESYTRADVNKAQENLINKEAENLDNQNAWWTVTLPTRTELFNQKLTMSSLKLDTAQFALHAMKQRLNMDQALNDKQIEMFDRNWEMMLKNYSLNKEKLGAMVKHWMRQDANQSKFAKAAIMNAIFYGQDVKTRRLTYNLAKAKFDKFSDEELGILVQKNLNMQTARKWMDIMGEDRSFLMNSQGSNINRRTTNSDLTDSDKMMYQLFNSVVNGAEDFIDMDW